MTTDTFDLDRFVQAQQRQYRDALEELRSGAKRTHWIWFVFPQLRGLGRSDTARFYGLTGVDEAKAYWNHPVLGARLRECIEAMLDVDEDRSATEVLGAVDALKFRSCLTLFLVVIPTEPLLLKALRRLHGGEPDPLTLELVRAAQQ